MEIFLFTSMYFEIILDSKELQKQYSILTPPLSLPHLINLHDKTEKTIFKTKK